ncbi:MAG TPA: hypothetical protein VFH24_01025 [Gemmatimonadales bacterium]|nr:hypothetical protein [Gemmatimonadales bacterium]
MHIDAASKVYRSSDDPPDSWPQVRVRVRRWSVLSFLVAGAFTPSLLLAQEPSGGLDATVHGLILMNAFHTSEDVNNSDVPQFVLPPGTAERSTSSATVRQSRVTVTGLAPEFAGGQLVGELDVDFYGGQQPSTGGRTFPLLRIRKAFAELSWSRFAILAGQESPPIAEVSPSSIASIGFPEFAASGNLWLWIPQIRLSADLPPMSGVRFGGEVAALAPTSGEAQGTFLTQPDAAERSGRPYLQGRVRGRWGAGEQEGEVSVGGHYGWLMDSTGGRITSRALAVSVWTPLAGGFELRGEAFTGEALAGLGGGGIGQNMVRNTVPVATKGGWVQLNYRAGSLELGAGGGIDDPDDDDLVAASRLRNTTFEGHVIVRRLPVVVGLEGRGIRTRYSTGNRSAAHVNLGIGVEF